MAGTGYSSSRVRLTSVQEDTAGTTPSTPRMWTRRFSRWQPRVAGLYVPSSEIRPDRTVGDQVKYGAEAVASLSYDMVPFIHEGPIGSDMQSLFYGFWNVLPEAVKDGTVSTLTSIAATTNVVTCSAVDSFRIGHLVRFSGFTASNGANNGVKRCTTASATVPAFSAAVFVNETAPVGSRMKVVGFAGTSGDITATATGLASTTLDFTTLGLRSGDWIKIGGEATGTKFATAALNGIARVVTVAANALTLDHRPTGWTTDAGTGKTIWVWMGDTIRNGLQQTTQTFQHEMRGNHEASAIDSSWLQVLTGMTATDGTFTGEMNRPLEVSLNFDGMGANLFTSTLDSTPEAASTQSAMPVFVPRMHVKTFIDPQLNNLGGDYVTTPLHLRSFSVSLNNNTTRRESANAAYAASITPQHLTVTGSITSFFDAYSRQWPAEYSRDNLTGSIAIWLCNKITTAASANAGQSAGLLLSIPRVKFMQPTVAQTGGVGQDLVSTYQFTAAVDETVTAASEPGTGSVAKIGVMVSLTNFEYMEF